VVVLLTWLYLSAYILLFGAELNSEIEHQTAKDTTDKAEKPSASAGLERRSCRGSYDLPSQGDGEGTMRSMVEGASKLAKSAHSTATASTARRLTSREDEGHPTSLSRSPPRWPDAGSRKISDAKLRPRHPGLGYLKKRGKAKDRRCPTRTQPARTAQAEVGRKFRHQRPSCLRPHRSAASSDENHRRSAARAPAISSARRSTSSG
jgi:hypothetical protein